MDAGFLLEFQYEDFAVVEYLLVFSLQLSVYLLAAGFFAVLNNLLKRWGVGSRIEPRENYPSQFYADLKGSITTCAIIAIYFYVGFAFIEQAYPASMLAAAVNILVFVIIYDFYMYVTHRLLHISFLRRFHGVHHTARSATSWSCLNLHPVEALINYLPFFLFSCFSSVSLLEFLGVHLYLMLGIANSHGNYSLSAKRSRFSIFTELSTFHQKHHSDGRGNYGYLFTHYDWIFGTRHK